MMTHSNRDYTKRCKSNSGIKTSFVIKNKGPKGSYTSDTCNDFKFSILDEYENLFIFRFI